MQKIKLTLIIIYILFTSTKSIAQQELSLSAGINRSGVEFTNLKESGWQYKPGYFVGIRNVYLKKEKIEISSEIQFSTKGWSLENALIEKQTYKYLDGLHLITFKPIKQFGIFAGINTGILLNHNEDLLTDRNFDPGLVTGISIGSTKLKFIALYNQSLLNNELDIPSLEKYGIEAHNSNLQVGLRYVFFNKKKEKNEDNQPKDYEVGISSIDLKNFKVLFKEKIDDKNYIRYNLSIADIQLDDLDEDNKPLSINAQLGIGMEKRISLANVEILHGLMYGLGLDYQSGFNFSISPSLGYLIGVQYNYKTLWNFGFELIPSITLNYTGYRKYDSNINTNFNFKNSPNFFVTYKINQ